MLMFGRMLAMAMALLGGIVFSQAPEFAQQYRQRIGGALDELRAVIARFDSEADRNGLDRERALGIYSASPERFLRSQGDSMRHTFSRYENLEQQSRELQEASQLAKPLILFSRPDADIFANAWRDYVPGVPVSVAGLIWGGVGLILGWLAAALFGAASLRARRPRRRRHVAASHSTGGDVEALPHARPAADQDRDVETIEAKSDLRKPAGSEHRPIDLRQA
ncbi:DUF2937 family protein [Neorhizobium sp. NPDC001467]|uniref:DUF2937 family protein n=1 Tax=Neorhizobium sp. NPDC001467 TaxID=3390595 RepID=UPI003D01EEE7